MDRRRTIIDGKYPKRHGQQNYSIVKKHKQMWDHVLRICENLKASHSKDYDANNIIQIHYTTYDV